MTFNRLLIGVYGVMYFAIDATIFLVFSIVHILIDRNGKR